MSYVVDMRKREMDIDGDEYTGIIKLLDLYVCSFLSDSP